MFTRITSDGAVRRALEGRGGLLSRRRRRRRRGPLHTPWSSRPGDRPPSTVHRVHVTPRLHNTTRYRESPATTLEQSLLDFQPLQEDRFVERNVVNNETVEYLVSILRLKKKCRLISTGLRKSDRGRPSVLCS